MNLSYAASFASPFRHSVGQGLPFNRHEGPSPGRRLDFCNCKNPASLKDAVSHFPCSLCQDASIGQLIDCRSRRRRAPAKKPLHRPCCDDRVRSQFVEHALGRRILSELPSMGPVPLKGGQSRHLVGQTVRVLNELLAENVATSINRPGTRTACATRRLSSGARISVNYFYPHC